jgi:glycogen debranching enzyme
MSTAPREVRIDDGHQDHPLTAEEERKRKQRILTHGTPSITSSISDAVVIKDENIFFLTDPGGDVPVSNGHGLGLYYHDCRYLRGYQLRLAGAKATVLACTAARGDAATFQLANPDIQMSDGRLVPKESIGIKWARTLDGQTSTLHDVLILENFGFNETAEFPLSLAFAAKFEDIFAVRGLFHESLGHVRPAEWHGDTLRLAYDGKDGRERILSITFSASPVARDGTTAHFHMKLPPRQTERLEITIRVTERPEDERRVPPRYLPAELRGTKAEAQREHDPSNWTTIHSDSLLLNQIVHRALGDLRMLRSSIDGQEFFAAGVPWFATLFGRDSIITAIQTLAYEPRVAEHTARLLAQFQGHRVDEWRDEQPGKILHSLRVGEMARLGEIPHTPYYGSVDATPLFLILIGRYTAWTGDLALFNDLRENIELALHWMSTDADVNGDGYIEYASTSQRGLINQGWKDSGDAIVDADGHLATPPIALVEVQGYAYLARTLMAGLYERTGDHARAEQLRHEAATLRERFNRDFWVPSERFYALALEAKDAPVTVISSNPGHALWSGIADEDKAKLVVQRLMERDMYNGWGIRTLSQHERRYNPVGYHLGTVWPHDNALIAVGFRRYGFDDEASQVLSGLTQAVMHFANYRMPELFSGFSREEYGEPVRFPVACHPQAWAAGSIPYLLESILGLVPEAFERRLRIVRPLLPEFVDRLEIHGLNVGQATVALRFERTAESTTAVTVLETKGEVEVLVEPGTVPESSST